MCLPRTTGNIPLLPITNQQSSSTQRSTNIPLGTISQPVGSNSQPPLGNVALRAQSSTLPPPRGSRDIYWCVEKTFTEPTENHLFSILSSDTLNDDEELYHRVNQAISSSRGPIGWWFSWKRCTEVDFIEVTRPELLKRSPTGNKQDSFVLCDAMTARSTP